MMNTKVIMMLFLMCISPFVEAQTAGDGDGDGAAKAGDGDGDGAAKAGDGDGDGAAKAGDGDGDGAAKAGDGDGDGATTPATPPPTAPPTPPPTPLPTPVPTTPVPTPDLNNGQWALHDINYYRRFVTKGDNKVAKQQLKDLMAMNETNETELLLLTPLSAAPTPAPPTPAPTPIPQDVVSKVKFATIASAADFIANKVVASLTDGLASTAQVTTTFTVAVKARVNPAPTAAQCKAAYALVFSLPESAVSCTVTPVRRLGALRRLAEASVSASGQTADASQADAAKTAAGDDNALKSSLQTVDSATFANVVAAAEAPTMAAETQIIQQAADPEEAAKLSKASEDKLQSNTAAAAAAAGVEASTIEDNTVVEQVPTPTPTKVPTATPTALPAGFTVAPTNMPTYMPSKMPTATPTAMPTKTPTATPTKTPTQTPTATPTKSPTATPTKNPTASPTKSPTKMPTSAPTPVPPTSAPTMSPTNMTEEESGANPESAGFLTAAILALTTLAAMQ